MGLAAARLPRDYCRVIRRAAPGRAQRLVAVAARRSAASQGCGANSKRTGRIASRRGRRSKATTSTSTLWSALAPIFSQARKSSDRIYLSSRSRGRDLAVALLVDASLSTDAWVGRRRVIDIAREVGADVLPRARRGRRSKCGLRLQLQRAATRFASTSSRNFPSPLAKAVAASRRAEARPLHPNRRGAASCGGRD